MLRWAGNTGKGTNPDLPHSLIWAAVGLMVGLLAETFKEKLQVPSGCHFAVKGGSRSLLMSTLAVELHQPEPQRMLRVLQSLLQPATRFATSATEQTLYRWSS